MPFFRYLTQYTNFVQLVARATKFSTLAPYILGTIFSPTHQNVYQFTCTDSKESDVSEVQRSYQNRENWLHGTTLAPRIWM